MTLPPLAHDPDPRPKRDMQSLLRRLGVNIDPREGCYRASWSRLAEFLDERFGLPDGETARHDVASRTTLGRRLCQSEEGARVS
ncbi:MAG: hypothetical protein QF681_19265, partial [Vicinamibacterales bacterium]|nr:hypothetical protein [Vicinamibacterales bacterium]